MFFFKSKERRLLAKIVVATISFGLAGFDWYRNREVQGYDPSAPFTLAVLVVLVELVLELHYLLREKFLRDEEDLVDRVDIFCRNNPGLLAEHLHVVHDMIRATLNVEPDDRAFTVSSRSQAIDTYYEYWSILVDAQKKIFEAHKGKNMAGKGYRVRAIHRTSIDVWISTTGWQADAILRSHRDFIQHGGAVERILVHKDEQPNEDYKAAIARLKDCDVSVRYLQIEATKWRNLCKWDFMLVGFRDNETKDEAVIWADTDNEGNPTRAIYSCKPMYGDENLMDTWRYYHEQSTVV